MATQFQTKPIKIEDAENKALGDKISEPNTTSTAKLSARRNYLKLLKPILIASFASAAVVGGVIAWNYFSSHQETDDAYLTAHITPVSSRIEANVEQVLVDDNQFVKKGQIIVLLDPKDFVRKVDEAKAALERAQKESIVAARNVSYAGKTAQATTMNANGSVSSSDSNIDKASAAISEAESALDEQQHILQQKDAEVVRAKLDSQRYTELEKEGAVTTSSRDAALRDFNVATASYAATLRVIAQKQASIEEAKQQLKIAKANKIESQGSLLTAQASDVQVEVTQSQKDVSQANIKEAEERLKTALLNLSYTKITAPIDGRIGRKVVEVGQRLQPGGRLLTLTGQDIWVVANFKESQLERIKVGQIVDIKIDAMPHEKFEGVVDSFSPGSGAQFTLLPPDNATGNFTKITQRVPVKIRFKTRNFSLEKIVPGLSATVSVALGK